VMVTFAMVHNITCNDVVNTPLPTDDEGGDGGVDDHSSSSGEGAGGHGTKFGLGFRAVHREQTQHIKSADPRRFMAFPR
jgi:hypothetical protein